MNRDRRSSSNDPSADAAADQSTQSASGLSSGRNRAADREERDDDRSFTGPLYTPRRYDQPIEADDDPVMPGDDATLNTKI